MEKLKITYSLRLNETEYTFSNLDELKNHDAFEKIKEHLLSFEINVKRAVGTHLLIKELGAENIQKYKVDFEFKQMEREQPFKE